MSHATLHATVECRACATPEDCEEITHHVVADVHVLEDRDERGPYCDVELSRLTVDGRVVAGLGCAAVQAIDFEALLDAQYRRAA